MIQRQAPHSRRSSLLGRPAFRGEMRWSSARFSSFCIFPLLFAARGVAFAPPQRWCFSAPRDTTRQAQLLYHIGPWFSGRSHEIQSLAARQRRTKVRKIEYAAKIMLFRCPMEPFRHEPNPEPSESTSQPTATGYGCFQNHFWGRKKQNGGGRRGTAGSAEMLENESFWARGGKRFAFA